ncbi:MAG TPA: hypothetical protein VMB47_00370 [Candidatus Aquilonibacter sp.]|nr:hypothetical protein [Candidatus Aquilonibacter sp.]
MKYARRVVMSMAILSCMVPMEAAASAAGQVPVRFPEDTSHAALVVWSLNNKEIGRGDLAESVNGKQVTSKLAIHFDDGSIYEERTDFTQDGAFHLTDYHLVQKGPAFRQAFEMTMDVARGTVTVRCFGGGGKGKTRTRHMAMPSDVANGILPFLARNMPAGLDEERVSMVVATPEPKLVQATISPMRSETFPFDGSKLETTRYAVRVDPSGFVGSLVKITGRQPPPSFIWMLHGKVPSFLMAQEDLLGGPVCRIALAVPVPAASVTADASGY